MPTLADVRGSKDLSDLAKAILQLNKKENSGITEDVAIDMAERTLYFYGYDNVIYDNMLQSDDRNPLFNTLENYGLITVEKVKDSFPLSGRFWNIYYIILNKPRIKLLVEKYDNYMEKNEEGQISEEEQLYNSVPEDVWKRD